MKKIVLSSLFFALFIATVSLFAAEPVCHPVKAEQFRVRGSLPNVIAKLQKGATVRIGYFGGSITAQAGWRVQTLDWFRKHYPQANVSEINAAIGGTGSALGVYRLQYDVLRHNPDLVFVEFAVNDGGASPQNIWRGMEGIVRQIWKANPTTDIAFVYTYRLGNEKEILEGFCPQSSSAMELLADHYAIPSINFMVPTVALERAGKLVYKADKAEEGKILFSTDGVHPRPAGHEIYTKAVADAFVAMEANPVPQTDHAAKLAKTFIEDNWESAKMIPVREEMLAGKWEKLDRANPLWKSFSNRFGDDIWHSGTPGGTLSFKFKGSAASVYDPLGPNGGQVYVTVDGKKSGPRARFDSFCTYHRIATLALAGGLDPNTVHTVVVEIDANQPDRKSVAFRLKNPEVELKAPKFQGTDVWFARLMLLGDLVE